MGSAGLPHPSLALYARQGGDFDFWLDPGNGLEVPPSPKERGKGGQQQSSESVSSVDENRLVVRITISIM